MTIAVIGAVCVALIGGIVFLARAGWSAEAIVGIVLVIGSVITPLLLNVKRTAELTNGGMEMIVHRAVASEVTPQITPVAENVQALKDRSDEL